MIKPFRNKHNKSSNNNNSGDRFEFSFYNIQALQVPKGWDKLYVSIVSAETGKPTSKSGKASVRHGNCRWTETLSDSVWISFNEASQEPEECLFKLLVSMGSAKSGILGEATVNLAGYTSSKASVVSLPLKKCNYGTILQVEIQCLTPRTIVGNEKRKVTNSYTADYDDVDSRSDRSDSSSFNKSVGSSSSNRLSGSSRAGELGSRETSFSISGSRPSVDSMDSLGRESISSQSGTANNSMRRQNSSDSQNIEELRAEARMWERNARKLQTEHDGLKQEIEQLQVLLEESTAKQKVYGNSKHKSKDKDDDIHKELEREIMFQKEENDNLAQQLKKAQESNLELVSCLQEMEETIENQKMEIESLSKSNSDDPDLNKGNVELELQKLRKKMEEKNHEIQIKEEEIANLEAKLSESVLAQGSKSSSEFENRGSLDQNEEIKALREKIQELENECTELTDENLELLMKLKESNKDLSTDGGAARNSSSKGGPRDDSPPNVESKLAELKKRETPDDNLQVRCNDLESKVEELELQLQEFKTLSEEQENELVALLQLLENRKAENSGNPTEADAEEKVTKDLAVENEMEGDNLKGNIQCSCQGLESQIEELKADLLLKEEEIEALTKGQRDLENQISNLENIEETIEIIQREGEGIAKRNMELESCKNELEQNLCEVEEENARLSQRVSDLESQLRYLNDSKESSHLNSDSNAMNLQDEIERLKNEMEAQRKKMRRKCKECSSLQKSNDELREQRVQLGEEIVVLKDQLEKIPILQDEILALKRLLNEIKMENERLKASLKLIDRDYEKSKAEKNSMEDRELYANDVVLKNEIDQIKRTNSELQWKIKCLIEEKEEWVDKVQTLEKELKQKKGVKEEKRASAASESDDNKQQNVAGSPEDMELVYTSKIQFLETELAEAMEANEMYKSQLKSLLAEAQASNSARPNNEKHKGNKGENENEDKLSVLEAELNDIRDRYLNMSLKYAEVEEQREQLVLKLKTVNDGARWKWFA